MDGLYYGVSPHSMGYHNQQSYARNIVPSPDPNAPGEYRAFYPYTPNEVKHRKRTTTHQLKVLEAIFKTDTKPNANLRTKLATELGMTARGVQVWFQNRRAKEKIRAGKSHLGDKELETGQEQESPTILVKDESDDQLASPSVDSPDAFSRSSPSTSPPQLHLITDPDSLSWHNSRTEPPPHSAAPSFSHSPFFTPASNDLFNRRGSLPANAFLQPEPSSSESEGDSFDPLIRRRSVDASLQRLASNPFAGLARAKNTALYGPGFGVTTPGGAPAPAIPTTRPHSLNRFPYPNSAYPSQRRGFSSQFANMPQHASMRRLSMDSRSSRVPASRVHQTPSPSPLTPYSAAVRASLPDHNLYAITSRVVASPIPGPLPSPGFSFGAANTPSLASPSSGDSERNSPDSLRSFTFRNEDLDEDGALSPSYNSQSRFGSVASITTSESSLNSSYYSETGAMDQFSHVGDRRDSCASGQFLGLMSDLDVNKSMQGQLGLASYAPHEGYAFGQPNTHGVKTISNNEPPREQQRDTDGSYASPTSTISPRGSPHVAQDSSAVSVSAGPTNAHESAIPISTTSELAFALEESKPDQQIGNNQDSFLTYGDHHQPSSHSMVVAPTTLGHVERHDASEQSFYGRQQKAESAKAQQAELYHQYHQDISPTAHYNPSNYSSLSDAYPAGGLHQHTQSQHAYTHHMSGYISPIVNNVITNTDDNFASYT